MNRLRVLSAALLLTACGTGIPPGLKYYFNADPRSLDPAISTDVPTVKSVTLLFDNLTQFDPDGRLVAGLATDWWTSPDGTIWTFRLHPGVRFHDGTTLDADAIRDSFVRALAMSSEGGRDWLLLPIEGAAEVAEGATERLSGLEMPVAAILPTPVPEEIGTHSTGSIPTETLFSWPGWGGMSSRPSTSVTNRRFRVASSSWHWYL